MTKVMTWTLTAAMIVGTGCAASRAKADEPRTAPAAEAAAELEAARAAQADAREAAEQGRAAAAEVREKLRSELGAARGALVRQGRPLKMEKAAHLGVSTSNVPGALREQMKLPRGFGLVVDTVGADSAAGAAGIQQYDILQKLNDQLLVNTQQLSVLIRSMKPGEQVTLTFLRGGQPQTVTATLTEKEVPVLGEASWNFEAPVAGFVTPTFEAVAVPEIGEVNLGEGGARNAFRFFTTDDNESKSVYTDPDMTLTITTDDDEKSLVAKDNNGQVLFDGDINTAAEREKLPKNVAERLAKFEERIKNIKVNGNVTIVVDKP